MKLNFNWFSKKRILPQFLRRETKSRQRKEHKLSSPLQEVKDSIDAERGRLDVIKRQLDSDDYDGALQNLLSDSSEDLFYFNAVKNKSDPNHAAAFQVRHGNLIDFQYPRDQIPPKDCIWVGRGYRNKMYRCHNKSIVCDGKETDLCLCPYHMKWCINTSNHPDVPVKINCPNESAFCNECYVVKFGYAPKQLRRIPGTKKI